MNLVVVITKNNKILKPLMSLGYSYSYNNNNNKTLIYYNYGNNKNDNNNISLIRYQSMNCLKVYLSINRFIALETLHFLNMSSVSDIIYLGAPLPKILHLNQQKFFCSAVAYIS